MENVNDVQLVDLAQQRSAFDADVSDGWIPCDPDAMQRAKLLDAERGLYVFRQPDPLSPSTLVEEQVCVAEISEQQVTELLATYGYDEDIRADSNFPLLLAEMYFETEVLEC